MATNEPNHQEDPSRDSLEQSEEGSNEVNNVRNRQQRIPQLQTSSIQTTPKLQSIPNNNQSSDSSEDDDDDDDDEDDDDDDDDDEDDSSDDDDDSSSSGSSGTTNSSSGSSSEEDEQDEVNSANGTRQNVVAKQVENNLNNDSEDLQPNSSLTQARLIIKIEHRGEDNRINNDNAIAGQKDNVELSIDDKQEVTEQRNENINEATATKIKTELNEQDVKANKSDKDELTDKEEEAKEEEDLEEGELKDDDDDDDDDDVLNEQQQSNANNSKIGYNNNDNNNNSGYPHKESSFVDNRHHDHHHPQHQHNMHHHQQHHQNYPPHHSASGGPMPQHQLQYLNHPNRRQMSPSQAAEMHGLVPYPNHHYGNNSNSNHYRYPPGDPGPPLPMGHPQAGPGMYPRGGPGAVGPMQKVNIRCRFYSKTSNKCTWGDHCRFEHRDDSPGPSDIDNRPPGGPLPQGMPPGGPPSARPPTQIPMSAADRGGHYPPYHSNSRHQPYPPAMGPAPYGPYDPYPHPQHHSTPPPLPPHHWRQQHSPYPSPSSNHPPESISPSPHQSSSAGGSSGRPGATQPIAGGSNASGGSSGASASAATPSSANLPPMSGALSPGGSYPSPSSSSTNAAVVYERKHRLAYEMAPWNDSRGPAPGYGPPPGAKYDRGEPNGPYPGAPGRSSFYRNHHYPTREPYGREPMPPHLGGGGYPANYPSAYRGGPIGHHHPSHNPHQHNASHYNRFTSSSQRGMPQDVRRSRSNKRGHDEDESSWSDSGSDDSILGQANYASRNQASSASASGKPIKSANLTSADIDNQNSSNQPPDEGSGTPPGEPLPEDRERQEMLLNKLKEIEDLMAKKKGEQD